MRMNKGAVAVHFVPVNSSNLVVVVAAAAETFVEVPFVVAVGPSFGFED